MNRLKIRESQKGKCIKIKRPAHLSIVERLGGYWCCKGTKIIRNQQIFREIFISFFTQLPSFSNSASGTCRIGKSGFSDAKRFILYVYMSL